MSVREAGGGAVVECPLPAQAGSVVDVVPVAAEGGRPVWLVLDEAGRIGRWDLEIGSYQPLAATDVSTETESTVSGGRRARRRLHACPEGRFAAVVNDYDRYGQVIDLHRGEVTMRLDNGGYHAETVPFSLAFTRYQGRTVLIHRTDWNRLDASLPGTGQLLTERGPTSYTRDEHRPEHYLDYFHGALYISPDGRRILDDGWVWHPVGFPAVWSIERWLGANPWELEDGPSRIDVCGREWYWDHPMTWIDTTRVALQGLGDDADDIRPGARIFDITRPSQGGLWRMLTAAELISFSGPTGRFFSDGVHLYASDDTGLHIWNPADGSHLSTVAGFSPTHHDPHRSVFLQLTDTSARSWAYR